MAQHITIAEKIAQDNGVNFAEGTTPTISYTGIRSKSNNREAVMDLMFTNEQGKADFLRVFMDYDDLSDLLSTATVPSNSH